MLTQAEANEFESQAKEAGAYRAEIYVGHAGYGVRVWPTKKHYPLHYTDLRGQAWERALQQVREEVEKG